jgi:5-methylcytosine-specific restriction enzyme subunit McrC
MAALNSQSPKETIQFTEYGIPIRNLWHMLLYAWNEVPLKNGWVMEEVEHAPTLDALLSTILMKLMQGRMRIGLGQDYINEKKTIRGIRGRIDFGESLRRHTFERGEAHCEFQQYSANELRNQIIRSTLSRLIQTGQFGPESDSAEELRHKLRRLTRDLDGIDLIEPMPDLIHRQQSTRNDRDYRLMLAICDLILHRQIPIDPAGGSAVPEIDRDALVLHNVYERFVANFCRVHLKGWDVTAQKRLEWHAKQTNEHLPSMIPDLVLQEKSSKRLLILDTKFTAHSLVENQWGKPVFDSSHLYQLYAYLRSQEHVSEEHRTATGILLYPAVQHRFSERIELQDHMIKVECIDLAAPWKEIEQSMLDLISKRAKGVE